MRRISVWVCAIAALLLFVARGTVVRAEWAITDQFFRVEWSDVTDRAGRPPLDETVPAKGRAYFDVPVPGGAPHRVSVMSFEFVEGSKS